MSNKAGKDTWLVKVGKNATTAGVTDIYIRPDGVQTNDWMD